MKEADEARAAVNATGNEETKKAADEAEALWFHRVTYASAAGLN